MKLPEIFANPVNIRSFAKGTPIFSAGDDSGEMFVVQCGEVDIILNGKVVETVGPEGFFGEISLIEDAARAADAVAKRIANCCP